MELFVKAMVVMVEVGAGAASHSTSIDIPTARMPMKLAEVCILPIPSVDFELEAN